MRFILLHRLVSWYGVDFTWVEKFSFWLFLGGSFSMCQSPGWIFPLHFYFLFNAPLTLEAALSRSWIEFLGLCICLFESSVRSLIYLNTKTQINTRSLFTHLPTHLSSLPFAWHSLTFPLSLSFFAVHLVEWIHLLVLTSLSFNSIQVFCFLDPA